MANILSLALYDRTKQRSRQDVCSTVKQRKLSRMFDQRDKEREISKAIIRFEKEFMGRGPLDARTFIIEDMVLVRLKNVLTPAELKLAAADLNNRGRYLIKQMRQELIEQGRPLLDAVIQDILNIRVVSLHTDISAKTGERIIVFTLEQKPEFEKV
jgi:uncharacterized protein YbcI